VDQAAHGYATGRPLAAADFRGGAETVQRRLEDLGFRVIVATNPAWDREEVILACDLVVDNGWRELRTNDPKVHELSDLLRRLPIHPVESRAENFRSPDSVSSKTTDLMTDHPDYKGARTRGSRLDRQVVEEFIRDPAGDEGDRDSHSRGRAKG
jgi:5-methylcytosine-specific restriction protein A